MKQKLFYIIFLFCTNLVAQTRDYNLLINGRVIDQKFKQPIIKAKIILKTDNGMATECYSDSIGFYEFKFQKVAFSSGTLSIESSKETTRADWGDVGYLASKDLGIFSCKPKELPKHLIKDFELTEAIVCGPAPSLHFKKNSVVFDTVTYSDKTEYPLEELQEIRKILEQNPKITVQLSAHCSKGEKDPKKLSKQRAEIIKKDLVEMGIPDTRLKTKGYGCTKPLMTDAMIKNATQEEKAILYSKNRRCTFSIVSFGNGKENEEEEEDE
jgi:outer membrane protein OmpA-like peptidoglycan-associated protein